MASKFHNRLIAVLVAAMSLIALAGCSSSDNDAVADGATIEHKFGETTVPADPQRVVTVGWNDQDFVLALGVVPVAVRPWYDNYDSFPWVQEATGGEPLATWGGADGVDLEAVANAEPDVIIAMYDTVDEQTFDQLSAIAPTVVQSDEYPDGETPWDVQLTTTGAALGKQDEAARLVAEVQGKIDEAKQAHPEFAGKVLVENFSSDDEFYLLAKGDPRRAIFDALGFEAQESVGEISHELATELDRDVLFINGHTKEQMSSDIALQGLSVVREDRTLYAGSDSVLSGALAYSGPYALLYALEKLVPQLANAVNGRPVEDLSGA